MQICKDRPDAVLINRERTQRKTKKRKDRSWKSGSDEAGRLSVAEQAWRASVSDLLGRWTFPVGTIEIGIAIEIERKRDDIGSPVCRARHRQANNLMYADCRLAMSPGFTKRRKIELDRMAAMLSRLGGRGYCVKEESAVYGSEGIDLDPDSGFDLDEEESRQATQPYGGSAGAPPPPIS